jgi:hypothetical protein
VALTVSTVGPHTLAFYSVDVAGNVETQKNAAFTITAPQPSVSPPTTGSSDGDERAREHEDRDHRSPGERDHINHVVRALARLDD